MPLAGSIPERLRRLLERSADCAVAELVAGAGYGKSTILDWLSRNHGVHVVKTEPRSDPLWALLEALAKAVASVAPSIASSIGDTYLNVRRDADTPRILGEWWAAQIGGLPHEPRRMRIALDDLHLLGNDSVTWQALTEVVQRSWDDVGWVLSSRATLQLPTTSWIAAGRMCNGIDHDDLLVRTEDVVEVALSLGRHMAVSEADLVVRRTQGWPLLIGFVLRVNDDHLDDAIARVQDRGIGALIQPVWSALSADQRDLLLRLSLLGKVTREDLRSFGIASAGKRIDKLVAMGIPILRDSRGDIRVHDLVTDYIVMTHAEEFPTLPEMVIDRLVRREEYDRSLSVALRLGDGDLAESVLKQVALPVLRQSQVSPIATEAVQIVTKHGSRVPEVIALRAIIETEAGHYEWAKSLYRDAISRGDLAIRSWSLVNLMMIFANRNEDLEPQDVIVLDDLLQRVSGRVRCELLALNARLCITRNNLEGARRSIAEAINGHHLIMDVNGRVRVLLTLAAGLYLLNEIDQSISLVDQASNIAVRHSVTHRTYATLCVLRSVLAMANDDCAMADVYIVQGLSAAVRTANIALQRRLIGAAWMRACERGDDPEVRAIAERCSSVGGDQSYWEATIVLSRSLMHCLFGDYHAAQRELRGTIGASDLDANVLERISLFALVNLELGLDVDARSLTSRVCRKLMAFAPLSYGIGGRKRSLASAAFLMLVVCVRLEIKHHIPKLVRFIDAMGFPSFQMLAQRVIGARVGRPQVGDPDYQVRGLWRLAEHALAGVSGNPLTVAERRVLALLAKGKTTKEIATELGRSPRTVENQLGSIARKLQVRGRLEIVVRARDVGLLEEAAH